MKKFTDKQCAHCGITYTPTGANSVFCSRKCKSKRRWQEDRQRRSEAGNPVGPHGGNHGRTNWNKHLTTTGIGYFGKVLRKLAKLRRFCERCSRDLAEALPAEWCSHHKDHNRANNVLENIELLCKRCHQVEHECWEALKA